jgi:hypothetical protein
MPRRSPRLAAKLPLVEPVLVVEPVVGGSDIYLESIEETGETHDSHVTVVENPVLVAEQPVVPPVPTISATQQQINNEVVARIQMFNRNMDTLTTKITDLSVAIDELKKKKDSKRKYCSLM